MVHYSLAALKLTEVRRSNSSIRSNRMPLMDLFDRPTVGADSRLPAMHYDDSVDVIKIIYKNIIFANRF